MCEEQGDQQALNRLIELAAPDNDHSWTWRLNPNHGRILEESEFVTAEYPVLEGVHPDLQGQSLTAQETFVDSPKGHGMSDKLQSFPK